MTKAAGMRYATYDKGTGRDTRDHGGGGGQGYGY